MTTFEQATVLARYARDVVRAALGGDHPSEPDGGVFDEPGASFVSLHWVGGKLQGCIGSLEPKRPLAADVAKNARAAALDDPRARMLSLDDVDALDVEVSVLGPIEPIVAGDEAEACSPPSAARTTSRAYRASTVACSNVATGPACAEPRVNQL